MGLTGLDIFKQLPKTNCGDCGALTCLAFAMKLAQQQASLDQCPHVSDAAKAAIRQPAPEQLQKCQRCRKKALRTEEFLEACAKAGLHVDSSTGEVQARLGGFSMFGTPLDASARIDEQRQRQHRKLKEVEDQRGFRCTRCSRVYCMRCLFHHARAHPSGGKACPQCGGAFETWD